MQVLACTLRYTWSMDVQPIKTVSPKTQHDSELIAGMFKIASVSWVAIKKVP